MTSHTARQRRGSPRALVVAALAAAIPGACTPLPDISPFATATADLAAAVRGAGPAVVSEVAQMEAGEPLAARLSEAWDARATAMDAIVSYSDSLVTLAGSAEGRAGSIDTLADALAALAAAAGFSLAASPAMGVATDAARFVWAQIRLAKAAESVEEALTTAQPAIDRIAQQLSADLADLGLVLRAAVENQHAALTGDPTYNAAIGTQLTLGDRKRALLAALAAREPDADVTDHELRQLERLDALLESNVAQLTPIEDQLDRLDRRAEDIHDLLSASSRAVLSWAVAHRDLASAVRARRPVDLDSLVAAAIEIRDLLRKVRDQ